MVRTFAETLMSAEASAIAGAAYGERTSDRTTRRNGYRERRWDTRTGSIDLRIPKLRSGSYFPDWLLEPRRRAERAIVQVVAQAYVEGVSTRRVDDLVRALGIEGISRSAVSEMASSLDEGVRAFRERPLDGGPYRHLWLDALAVRVREAGRIVSVWAVIATAVNAEGKRELLGLDVFTSEDGTAWTTFLRGLVARGLTGVELITSDAHEGLKAAIAAVLPGSAWQRCRTHFMRNLLSRVPRSAQPLVASFVRTIFAQPDGASTRRQHAAVVEELRARFPKAADCSRKRARISWRSPRSRRCTGARSGRTIRRSGSTARSADAPTSWASSPTATRSFASSGPCSRNSTMSGRWAGAT